MKIDTFWGRIVVHPMSLTGDHYIDTIATAAARWCDCTLMRRSSSTQASLIINHTSNVRWRNPAV